MSLTNQALYKRYINILNFLSNKNFRNLKIETTKYDKTKLIEKITSDEYIRIDATTERDTKIIIFLFNTNSIYIKVKGSSKFKSLIKNNKLTDKNIENVILISYNKINDKIKKHLESVNIKFEIINLKYFIMDISKGPLVPDYKKLDNNEIEDLKIKLKIDNLNQLRKILVLDPQMIYRDAKVGDVYRVTDYSLVSELYIKYVYVYES